MLLSCACLDREGRTDCDCGHTEKYMRLAMQRRSTATLFAVNPQTLPSPPPPPNTHALHMKTLQLLCWPVLLLPAGISSAQHWACSTKRWSARTMGFLARELSQVCAAVEEAAATATGTHAAAASYAFGVLSSSVLSSMLSH
jgi:hypothetical protein